MQNSPGFGPLIPQISFKRGMFMYNVQKIALSCLLSMAFIAVGAQSAFADCVDFGACNLGLSALMETVP